MGLEAAPEVDWKVIPVRYPTQDVVVAGLNVLDFGAVPDGRTDCTAAFQEALNAMREAGGGTVFVPEGFYRFDGRLRIPTSVTLRGEWHSPFKTNGKVVGSVLMPFADQGQEEGTAFVSVHTSAGIRDLTIWYPEQSAGNPTPYPFCLEQTGMNNATFQNLTLLNPYQGIKIGPQPNELHYVNHVFGTPLKVGIRYDSTTDIGRLERVFFSPRYWRSSGLRGAPVAGSGFEGWLRANGTGIHMLRSDWEYVDRVHVEGYQTGFMVTEGARGAANAQFRRLILRDCAVALAVDKTNPYGMVFTQCYFAGDSYGVLLSPEFNSVVLFSHCLFQAGRALESRGNGVVFLEQCRVLRGDLEVDRGVLSIVSSELASVGSRLHFGSDVDGVVISGHDFSGDAVALGSGSPAEKLQVLEDRLPLRGIPEYPFREEQAFRPASTELVLVWPEEGEDSSGKIQQALDSLASRGGVVLLPGEDYILRGRLRIPSGVELRGIHDVPHHTMALGSILHVSPPDGEPTIVMEAASGLRGLSFNYPDQDINDLKEFPFLIQGAGAELYIINVNAANPYRYLDLSTHRCDRHFVDYLSGSPLREGVRIGGGSRGGELRNLQFNPHYWSRGPRNNPFFANKTAGGIKSGTGNDLWEYQKANMDALVLSDCVDQFLYQNFVYGSLYGIRFTESQGKGPQNLICHGHGTDGSKIGVFFEHGSETITMINSELVAMSSEDKTAIRVGPEFGAEAVLINTMVWGTPDHLAEVESGTLVLQNLTATRHGDGIRVGQGQAVGVNLNFLNSRPGVHAQASGAGQGLFRGLVVRKELVLGEGEEGLDVDQVVIRK